MGGMINEYIYDVRNDFYLIKYRLMKPSEILKEIRKLEKRNGRLEMIRWFWAREPPLKTRIEVQLAYDYWQEQKERMQDCYWVSIPEMLEWVDLQKLLMAELNNPFIN